MKSMCNITKPLLITEKTEIMDSSLCVLKGLVNIVGNQPILCYINGPMFDFQSLLSTVCYRIHKGII